MGRLNLVYHSLQFVMRQRISVMQVDRHSHQPEDLPGIPPSEPCEESSFTCQQDAQSHFSQQIVLGHGIAGASWINEVNKNLSSCECQPHPLLHLAATAAPKESQLLSLFCWRRRKSLAQHDARNLSFYQCFGRWPRHTQDGPAAISLFLNVSGSGLAWDRTLPACSELASPKSRFPATSQAGRPVISLFLNVLGGLTQPAFWLGSVKRAAKFCK